MQFVKPSIFTLKNLVLSCLWVLALPSVAKGDSSNSLSSTPRAPRHFRVGVTVAQLTSTDLNSTNRSGAGVTTFWEFDTSPRSSLGIHAAYRRFGGEKSLSQLGYGLIMKHYIGELTEDVHGWYLNYGLLLQVLRVKDVDGSGTAHDTKLSVGYDWGGVRHWFVESSYHYSRLRYFETAELNADYMEFSLGCRVN